MANNLLTARGASKAGKNWAENFVKRTPELQIAYSRKYDRQRALCEDPRIIEPWFHLVRNVRLKYGIADADTYNFDESGFQMGVILPQLVITASERRSSTRAKAVQPGDREWATVIACINALGWAIPPFIIVSAMYHLSAWYEGSDLPPD
jgi:hypothetical protein